jgi:hypothetical protein
MPGHNNSITKIIVGSSEHQYERVLVVNEIKDDAADDQWNPLALPLAPVQTQASISRWKGRQRRRIPLYASHHHIDEWIHEWAVQWIHYFH